MAIEDDSKIRQGMWFLNIQYDNGTPVVVRDRESLLHGKGE